MTTRRKRMTKKQGIELVNAFRKSGLKIRDFCEEKKIRTRVLYHWLAMNPISTEAKHESGHLIPIKASFQPRIQEILPSSIKVVLPAGITLEIPMGSVLEKSGFSQILGACYDVVNR